ncbi:hypothetical protein A0U94_05350 [Gluconobacter albidus]|uniref:hypothetical protein n=1 Tax=Gluconobacter albidus TaxID=318683 RepID=UPI00098BBE3E|nr:hypothetical protein [Gluconobacter albidus]AQS90481.1 hypothetical protein A0U94_05350 [Gluconobacter albidus]
MSEKTRIAALQAAVSVPQVRDSGMGSTLEAAAALDYWLTSGPIRTPARCALRGFSKVGHSLFLGFYCGIDRLGSLFKRRGDICPIGTAPVEVRAAGFPVDLSEGDKDVPDQSLTGQVFTHDSSSSVLADGESGDSVAADPRNDATPDTSVKGVRDDG